MILVMPSLTIQADLAKEQDKYKKSKGGLKANRSKSTLKSPILSSVFMRNELKCPSQLKYFNK
jgi:hypothetical protein